MGFHVNLYECISLFLPSQPRPTKTLGSKDFPDVGHTFLQEADVCEGCPFDNRLAFDQDRVFFHF